MEVTFRSMMIKNYFQGNQVFKDVDDGSFKNLENNFN
jgi:hypothetical protein